MSSTIRPRGGSLASPTSPSAHTHRCFPSSSTSPQRSSSGQFFDSPPALQTARSTRSPDSPGSDDSFGLPYLRDGESPTRTTFAGPSTLPPPPEPLRQASGDGSGSGSGSPLDGSVPRPKARRRPTPLDLKVDPPPPPQQHLEPPNTAKSHLSDGAESNLSNDLQDLSLLRNTVHQNLRARPFDSPFNSDSGGESSGVNTPGGIDGVSPIPEACRVSVADMLATIDSSPQALIVDTRPLGTFLESHFPSSCNISIPSLLFKRFRRQAAGKTMSWESLGSFVSTPSGKAVWANIDLDQTVDVVILGLTVSDEMAKVLCKLLQALVTQAQVRVLKGGWAAVINSPEAMERMVAGENDKRASVSREDLSPLQTAPVSNAPLPPPIPPSEPHPASLSQHPSLPSLRTTDSTRARRNLPSLTIKPDAGSSRRPPKLSLNLDKPLRSATVASFSSELSQPPLPLHQGRSAGATTHQPDWNNAPRSAMPGSFQTLCLAQAKLPPSPSSFRDVDRSLEQHTSPQAETTARPNGSIYPTPQSPDAGPSSAITGTATATARALSPFIISTILPGFLYLGPEITAETDVKALQGSGIKRVLNVALECDDDEGLKLRETFERYYRIPMKDIVEESGVAKGLREACDFLDDARLHSAPTYVHCKAGKSRSVTVVLAYLIHANAWTLKMSYAYVAERRKGISPNIGFVAELMQFEEAELGLKQSGGVHGEASSGKSARPTHDDNSDEEPDKSQAKEGSGQKYSARYARESLPPAWAQSLDNYPRTVPLNPGDEPGEGDQGDGRRPVADEREVRKNGHWVHHRRAPVDRTTLQPGRRVSKAGLESLRSLHPTGKLSPGPSPRPSPRPGDEQKSALTPGLDGRLGWV